VPNGEACVSSGCKRVRAFEISVGENRLRQAPKNGRAGSFPACDFRESEEPRGVSVWIRSRFDGAARVAAVGAFWWIPALAVTAETGEPDIPIPPAKELLGAMDEEKTEPSPESVETEGAVAEGEVVKIDTNAGADAPEEELRTEKGDAEFEWGFKIRPDQPNLFLNLNGYAWHLNKGDESEEEVNDWPFGLGLTYELRRKKDYIWTVDGDLFFVDSSNDFAAALGSTILWRTKIVDIGARGGLLYKQNFVDEWGFPLGPVLLPVLQRDFGYFSVKVVYIPPVRKSTDEQLFFQVLIPLGGPVEKP